MRVHEGQSATVPTSNEKHIKVKMNKHERDVTQLEIRESETGNVILLCIGNIAYGNGKTRTLKKTPETTLQVSISSKHPLVVKVAYEQEENLLTVSSMAKV